MPSKTLTACLVILIAALAACRAPEEVDETRPPAQPAAEEPVVAQFEIHRDLVTAQPAVVVVVPLQPRGGRSCPPNGDPAIELSYPVCLQPVQYNCTIYWCIDPATGHGFAHPDRPNPECRQAQMQTEACSNEVELPEKFVPTREQVHEILPLLYPEEALGEPPPGAGR